MISIRRSWQAAAALVMVTGFASAATAGEPKPTNGSWRIQPISLAEPLKVTVGSTMTQVVEQHLIPEAAVLTTTTLQFGTYSLETGAALIKVTTKQGTAWCAINPLRDHPGEPKTSFAEALLTGRKLVQRRETPCFVDTNADGLMDSGMIGSDRGYLVPTISKLGKPSPVTPFAVHDVEPATVIAYPLKLSAELVSPKNEPPHLVFSLAVSSGQYGSELVGFGLVGRPGEPVSFALFSGLARIDTKFEEPLPLLYELGPVGSDGRVVVTVTQAMSARRFTLGNISRF